MDKTLLISEIFPPRHGGSGRWFVELYSRLPRDGFVICAGSTDGDEASDEQLKKQLFIERRPLSSGSWGIKSFEGLGFYWRSFRYLSKLIRQNDITRIHCGRCLPEGVMGLMLNLRYGLPFLCYVHGEDIQTAAESRELTWLIRRVFARATTLIANSHNTARILRDSWQVPDDKVKVLHPGMDAERFVPAANDAEFRSRMGWNDRPVILTVGRLQRRKGQDMLIGALPAVIQSHPNVLYAIVGNGDERERLETLAEEHKVQDNVMFLGEIDDAQMVQCYQQCTLFCLPNRTERADIEGFGMVLAEAQACGKAVVAGDSGGTRETMRIGETGLIVDCTAPEPLATSLNQLLSSPEQIAAMGEAGRAFVTEHFDWPVHVTKAREVFKAL